MSHYDGELSLDAVFTEPPRPPTPPSSTTVYVREPEVADNTKSSTDWKNIKIRLVGTHPLWGHYLWNAARAFATYLDHNSHIYKDGCVLELGAGGGLPGIVTALNGAQKVILTDYPDADLLDNLRANVDMNVPSNLRDRVEVEGYIWGREVQSLLTHLQPRRGYDLIILSDLIFNHSQHEALIQTCERTLAPPSPTGDRENIPCVLVFYSHHKPRKADQDMNFFRIARQNGWKCEEVLKRKYPPMFPDDTGDQEMRSTVYGWKLTKTTVA